MTEETVDEHVFGWQTLPDVLLEDIFALLSLRDRYNASQVCRHWFQIFYSSKVWSKFTLNDITLTKRKYNYYLGYQRILDHYRTQVCKSKNTIKSKLNLNTNLKIVAMNA